jgi:Cys-tRNA(Pro)/Cys-tRNA(Cys) deacylase
MTPAINQARQANISFSVHEYEHDPNTTAYGEEAATKLGLDSRRVFKTLVVAVDTRKLAVAVLPVSSQLDLKHFARAVGSKKVTMADKKDVESATGYVLGGISPIGQRKPLKTIIDQSATMHQTIYVSAGRRGLEIELSPDDLCSLTNGEYDKIKRS